MDIVALIQAQYQKGLPTLNSFCYQMEPSKLFVHKLESNKPLEWENNGFFSMKHFQN